MSPLKAALLHINVSVPVEMDESTFVACIKGFCRNENGGGTSGVFFWKPPWV